MKPNSKDANKKPYCYIGMSDLNIQILGHCMCQTDHASVLVEVFSEVDQARSVLLRQPRSMGLVMLYSRHQPPGLKEIEDVFGATPICIT
jgi:hypothetical protein